LRNRAAGAKNPDTQLRKTASNAELLMQVLRTT